LTLYELLEMRKDFKKPVFRVVVVSYLSCLDKSVYARQVEPPLDLALKLPVQTPEVRKIEAGRVLVLCLLRTEVPAADENGI
jgi:hypothetical protein